MNIFLLLLVGLIIIIIFILLVWAGVDSVKASYDVKRIPGYKNNEELQSVHKYMTIASIICWISVIVIIGIIILMLFFSGELFAFTAASGSSTFSFVTLLMYGSLGILLALLLVVGIYSSMSWDKMKKSKIENDDKFKTTLDYIKTVTYLTIGSIGVLLFLIFLYFVIKVSVSVAKKNKIKKEKEELLDAIVKYA